MTNELAAKRKNSRKLTHYTPIINSEQGFQEQVHRQETPPFYVSPSQQTHVFQKAADNSDFTTARMEKKSELQDLLEELVNTDITEETNTTEKPWWLQEESLLGEVKLDYEDNKIEAKPVTNKEENEDSDNKIIKIEQKIEPSLEEKENVDNKLAQNLEVTKKATKTLPISRATRIPMKEVSRDIVQGQATGGATPSEGTPTGAGTGQRQKVAEIRQQKMGGCTIQLVRVPATEPDSDLDDKDKLWWVTPATEVAVKHLMVGEDVTSQQCADCGFRGTKKRVRVHSLQHFCKYACQCGLLKSSRDAVYDHQVSKNGSEEHGGPKRRIYCIDEASYSDFCQMIGWDDPPAFGEAKPNRTGKQRSTVAADKPTKKPVSSRLGKQHKPASPTPEEEEETAQHRRFRIPWTPEALISKTREYRQTLGIELAAQMAIVQEALSQERGGTPEQQCELHAELEVMRQAYVRLSRD